MVGSSPAVIGFLHPAVAAKYPSWEHPVEVLLRCGQLDLNSAVATIGNFVIAIIKRLELCESGHSDALWRDALLHQEFADIDGPRRGQLPVRWKSRRADRTA